MPGDHPPWEVDGGGGLRALVVDGGAPASLATADLELVQHAASAFEPGLVQVWLRDRAAGGQAALLGAGSGGQVAVLPDRVAVTGRTGDDGGPDAGLAWQVTFALAEEQAWAWHVEVRNDGPAAREVDLVHTHDVALAGPGMLRTNELYVSQYLDLTPLDLARSVALAVRQNLPQAGRHPWCVLATDGPTASWATDALDVHGTAARNQAGHHPAGIAADLPGRRLQHEHTLAALQTAPTTLAPGETLRTTFAGLLLDDHAGASGPDDAVHARRALDLARATAPWTTASTTASATSRTPTTRPAPAGRYARGSEVQVRALSEDELADRWPGPWLAVERDEHDQVLSFFTPGDQHVVVAAKELAVLRPHGTILRTGDAAVPDPASLTTTAWMTGSPLSYLTRGHTSRDRVLTTVRGYLGLHRAYGLRLFVEVAGTWRLLDLPSAFATAPDGAHWVHALDEDGGGAVEVSVLAPPEDHRLDLRVAVTDGPARRVMAALHLGTGADPLPTTEGTPAVTADPRRVVVRLPAQGAAGTTLTIVASHDLVAGDDGPLFDDGVPRVPGVVTLVGGAGPDAPLDLRLTVQHEGERVPAVVGRRSGDGWWSEMTALRVDGDPTLEPLSASLPWLVRDALVHHLAPRGLEQYSGGAWGTRDVTQGPLELLLALDRAEDARQLLLQVLAAQEPDGSWPQAFGFLPGDEGFRMGPPHGDVVHWPVLAVGRYLESTGDAGLLTQPVPWFGTDDDAPVLDHVLRALEHARAGYLPGTHLVAYGHGDWNDSLQPADPAMSRTMTSTWTVTLHHQALRTLADGLDGLEDVTVPVEARPVLRALVTTLRSEAQAVAADLERHLLVDGELAGYALLDPDGVRHLVHPRDAETGLRHGSLQMIHALGADLLDPDQAAHHVALVREHLTGVDGVRLFDRPPGYHGGETRHFQRAETATFVGREIGLMYVHAHLRWVEAMARWGDPDALWHGLQQVLAPAAVDVVPGARRRQANTYASSSDAAVRDRVEFAARYDDVLTGATGLEGGWRIYSSGPGVLVRIVAQCFLGIRRRGASVEVDPVVPAHLDGLQARVPLLGGVLRVRYRVGPRGHGPVRLVLADRSLDVRRASNPYREGGVLVALTDLTDALGPVGSDGAWLEVHLP